MAGFLVNLIWGVILNITLIDPTVKSKAMAVKSSSKVTDGRFSSFLDLMLWLLLISRVAIPKLRCYQNYPGGLLKMRVHRSHPQKFRRLGSGPGVCISNKQLGYVLCRSEGAHERP